MPLTSFPPARTARHHRGSEHALPVSPQVETRAQAAHVFLDVGTTTDSGNARADAVEQGMVGLAQAVVHPATLAPLLHKPGRLEHLEVPGDVGLGLIQGIDELAYARARRHCEQAAREAQPDAIPKRSKQIIDV